MWWGWFGFLCLASAALAGLSAAPWVPTRARERDYLVAKISRKPTDTIVDLGSGTGTLLFALAQAGHPGPLIGYEISVLPFLIALGRKYLGGAKYRNIQFKYQSLWRANIQEADIILCFLLPGIYEKLASFLKQARPKTVIVVAGWPLPDWDHTQLKLPKTLTWYIHEVQ